MAEFWAFLFLALCAGGMMYLCAFLITNVPFLGIALCITIVLLAIVGIVAGELKERREQARYRMRKEMEIDQDIQKLEEEAEEEE